MEPASCFMPVSSLTTNPTSLPSLALLSGSPSVPQIARLAPILFEKYLSKPLGFPSDSAVKNLPAMQEPQKTRVRSLGWEDALEKEMATHSGILAWEIPWTEDPGRLQSIGLQRVRHD